MVILHMRNNGSKKMLECIGKSIKHYRTLRGLTQERLAELTNLSVTSISRLENGKSMVSFDKLYTIANVLETDFDLLICSNRKHDISPEEKELIYKYRSLSPDNLRNAMLYIEFLLNMQR